MDLGQFVGLAMIGQVAGEQAEVDLRLVSLHLPRDSLQPGTALLVDGMSIVDDDEVELLRPVFALGQEGPGP